MKLFFTGLAFLVTTSVFACPNFTGEYVNQEFGTYYSIAQDSCDSIQYVYDEGVVDTPVDGKEYQVDQYDIVVTEGEVLATVSIFEMNEFKGNKLITKARSETVYKNGDKDIDSGWSEMFLNKENDLVTVSHSKNGTEKIIEKRVR